MACNAKRRSIITRSTGTKLSKLEKLDAVKNFVDSLLKGKVEEWTKDEALGFSEIYYELIHKINDCVAPLSNAFYSSIMIYENDSKYLIHSGANLDPENCEQLQNPIYRNCAEKQAAISAQKTDGATNKDLKAIFLFRKDHNREIFSSEKLIPCKDCYRTYLEDLIENDGKLILVIEDSQPREFLLPGYSEADSVNEIRTIKTAVDKAINYVIIDAEAMKFLRIEKELGARVCSILGD